MNKRFVTMITRHYCPDWTANNAIREWVANALDDSSSFEYSFGRNDMQIASRGVELPFRALALGVTTKRNDSSAVGTHGEGLLIALGVAIREGLDVVIKNGTKLWQAAYEWDETIGEEVLVIHESPLADNEDLVFEISGVTEELQERVRHDCLYLQDDLGETLDGDTGRILLGKAGKLYVGGIYVTDTKMQYSYDFNPDVLSLNRDRKSVDNWNLGYETARIWNSASDGDTVAQMMFDSCPDVKMAKYTSTSNLSESCFKMYNITWKDLPLASDIWEAEEMEKEGYKDIVITGNSAFTETVKQSRSYKALSFDKEEVEEGKSPLEMLEDAFDEATKQTGVEHTYDMWEMLIEVFEDRGVSWDD